jgi:carbonic anhydrase/acetyltransferase-like protein (isoleucine patch superfamily)
MRCTVSDLEQQLITFLDRQPRLGPEVYIAPGAVLIGDVTVGEGSSVWFNAVLRGDLNRIVVGYHTNIQDNCVLHLADEVPCILGDFVTVGHNAIVHAASVGSETLVGMGSRILDGAVIGEQCVVGAGAVVTQGACIPPGSLVLGMPAKVVRALTSVERAALKGFAEKYVELAAGYLRRKFNDS